MRACAVLLLVLGCRFGGPTGAPVPPDATGPAAEVAAPADAAAPSAEVAADATLVDATAPVEVSPPAGCAPPAPVSGCDPVCNTGCPPLSRCDVGAAPRTGACVGIWITGEGEACFKGSGTDACAARLTCTRGVCRRLCYRDADCPAGACCKTPHHIDGVPSGFLLCAPC
jgi:hypothetical protein